MIESRLLTTIFKGQPCFFAEADNELQCVSACFPLGLTVCVSGDMELRVRLLKLRLEVLVRSGGEKAADQALETFSQVICDVHSQIHTDTHI